MRFKIDKQKKILLPLDQKAAELFNRKKEYINLKVITEHKRRSIDQNRLWWAYYKDIAQYMKVSIEYAHIYCKYHIGAPILRARDNEFEKSLRMLEGRFSYEELFNVLELFPVTRLFTVDEGVKYTEELQRYWSEQGLVL